MKRSSFIFISLVLNGIGVVWLTGCNGESSWEGIRRPEKNLKYYSGHIGSCEVGRDTCVDFTYAGMRETNPHLFFLENRKQYCKDDLKGTFRLYPCPSGRGSTGICTYEHGITKMTFLYDGLYVREAKATCEKQGGTFTYGAGGLGS